jgi:hypothetical protein
VKYAVETDSDAMIYITSLMQIGSDIQKLTWGFPDTERAWKPHKLTLGE